MDAPVTQRTGRRQRLNWKHGVIAGIGCVVGAVLFVTWLALRTPGWYRPPVVDAGERQDVRDNLVMAEQAMTESLRGRQPFVYQLHQDDVNRWLAARREIYPLIDELAPQALGEPFIRFDAGRITMAGRIQYGGASVVASLDVVPAMEDDAIVLRASRIRCGSLPVPIDLHEFGLDGDVNFDAEEAWPGSPPIIGNAEAGLRIGRRAWWKNGGVEYVVRDVKVEPGVLKLEIEPLGPHYVEDRRQD